MSDLTFLRNKATYLSTESVKDKIPQILEMKKFIDEYMLTRPKLKSISAVHFKSDLPMFAIRQKNGKAEEIVVYINPTIKLINEQTKLSMVLESSGLIPKVYAYVNRYDKIIAEYLIVNNKGVFKRKQRTLTGFEAIWYQQMYDLLKGKIFLDRALPITEDKTKSLRVYRVHSDTYIYDYYFDKFYQLFFSNKKLERPDPKAVWVGILIE